MNSQLASLMSFAVPKSYCMYPLPQFLKAFPATKGGHMLTTLYWSPVSATALSCFIYNSVFNSRT
jgi:hypothetical protein